MRGPSPRSDAGKFKAEIVPVPLPQRKGPPQMFETDENPRRDTCIDVLRTLKPAFKEGGTVTAGNAPGITDGAAAVVVARRSIAVALGLKPLARVTACAQAAVKPLELFTAPGFAVRKVAAKLDRAPADFDLIEINEAFAAQAVANIRALELDPEKVNVNGGAIALGHPIGASGARGAGDAAPCAARSGLGDRGRGALPGRRGSGGTGGGTRISGAVRL